jgi:two-component system sensor kinase FixL
MPPMQDRPPRMSPALAAGYLVLFVLLDWAGYIHPLPGLNVTPWNPQPALAVTLLLVRPRALPLVWVGLLLAELLVRGQPPDPLAFAAAAGALALTDAAMARALVLTGGRSLGTRRDLAWFAGIVVGGGLMAGLSYVLTFLAAGLVPASGWMAAVARYWVGDSVGLLVTLPPLLMLLQPRGPAALRAAAAAPAFWGAAVLIVALIAGVFARDAQSRFFYLLLLPVVWASARLGLGGAVLAAALTQVGLIAAVLAVPHPDLTVFELQLLMAAITATGLMLGVAVDERERATLALRGSLRLAAAGQMAAALAHELSQPLTALSGHAQALRLLAARPDGQARLAEVSGRVVEDAHRAADVVKRLRDFFRSGTTQLAAVEPQALLEEAAGAHRRRAEALQATLRIEPGTPPPLRLDAVQISLVLRNLLANALDAAGERGQVQVRWRRDGDELRLEVDDSGPGIDAARLATLFDAGPSDKPGGMGVGLAISRAIVEAHGGRLWAEPGRSGRLRLALPLDDHNPDDAP